MAIFRVKKTKDFTVMSNHHLRNVELSLKAKGLLSLMLSLPENWDYTTKGLASICKDGVDSISTALKELEQHGYLTRYRLRGENGQLGGIEYTVHEIPQMPEKQAFAPIRENPGQVQIELEKPKLENPGQVQIEPEKPKQENPRQVKSVQGKPIQEKHAQLNTNILNTNILNTNQSNHIPTKTLPADGTVTEEEAQDAKDIDFLEKGKKQQLHPNEDGIDKTDMIDNADTYTNFIRDNLDYNHFILEYPDEKELFDEIFMLICDIVCVKRKTIRINREEYPYELVKARFLNLNREHVEYVMDRMKRTNSKITNIRSYLITALFNAPITMNYHYQQSVQHAIHKPID